MTTPNDVVNQLEAVGFTQTEALVYCELLRSGPASGYRLAQTTGKARANVYQALSQLTRRGAALVDDSEVQTFRATEPEELMRALAENYRERNGAALQALRGLASPVAENRIYHLKTADQVIERALAMIARAQSTVVIDAFPEPLLRVLPALEGAAARGVTVAAHTYAETPPVSFTVVRSAAAAFAIARWPGLQLSIVTDATEHLLALFEHGMVRVLHGIWSDSAYLSCLQHSGIGAEIRLGSLLTTGDPLNQIALLEARPPGLQGLISATGNEEEQTEAAA